MFESYIADAIASTLGRYLDVQRDQLRISLWSGQGVLENVKLRPEALDHLQLPIKVQHGSVGRLKLQIPWGRWMVANAPLTIELSDIELRVTPRDERDWSEGPAQARDWVAKQAELAAAEIAKLSKRSGWGRWRVIEYLVTYLINNLRLSITNLHLQFCDDLCGSITSSAAGTAGSGGQTAQPPEQGWKLGLQVASLGTSSDTQSFSSAVYRLFRRAPQGAQIQRDIRVQGLQVYMDVTGDRHTPGSSPTPSSTQPAQSPVGILHTPAQSHEQVVEPVNMALRVAVRRGGADTAGSGADAMTVRLEVLSGIEHLHVKLSPAKLHALLKLSDEVNIWAKRQRYGRFRPAGWACRSADMTPGPRAVLRSPSLSPAPSFSAAAPSQAHLPGRSSGGTGWDGPGSAGRACASTGSTLRRSRSTTDSGCVAPATAMPHCTWADMWRYAGRAVLYDLRQRWLKEGAPPAVAAVQQRRLAWLQLRYVQLYETRLVGMGSPMSDYGDELYSGDDVSDRGHSSGGNALSEGSGPGRPAASSVARQGSGSGADAGTAPLVQGGGDVWDDLVEELAEEAEAEEVAAQERDGAGADDDGTSGGDDGDDASEGAEEESEADYEDDEDDVAAGVRRRQMDAAAAELERMEAELDVVYVLQFRSVAEQLMQELAKGDGAAEKSAAAQGSWVMWGIAGIAGFVGAVSGFSRSRPGRNATAPLPSADVRELQRLLHMSASHSGPAATAVTTATSGRSTPPPTRGPTAGRQRVSRSDGGLTPTSAGASVAQSDTQPQSGIRVTVELLVDTVQFSLLAPGARHTLLAAQLASTSVQLTLFPGRVEAGVTVTDAQVLDCSSGSSQGQPFLYFTPGPCSAVSQAPSSTTYPNRPDYSRSQSVPTVNFATTSSTPPPLARVPSGLYRAHTPPPAAMELSWHAGEGDEAPPMPPLRSTEPRRTPGITNSSSFEQQEGAASSRLQPAKQPVVSVRFTVPTAKQQAVSAGMPSVSVTVAPVVVRYPAALLRAVGSAMAQVKVSGTLGDRLQHSVCELGSFRAQTDAKLQLLQHKPPNMQLQVELQGAVLQMPASSTAIPQLSAVEVRVGQVLVCTPTPAPTAEPSLVSQWLAKQPPHDSCDAHQHLRSPTPPAQPPLPTPPPTPAPTTFTDSPAPPSSRRLRTSLSCSYHAGPAGSDASPSPRSQDPGGSFCASPRAPQTPTRHNQVHTAAPHADSHSAKPSESNGHMLSPAEERVLYFRMRVDVSSVQVLFTPVPGLLTVAPAAPQAARGLQPLTPPLTVSVALASNRLGADTTLPKTAVQLQLGSTANITLKASALSAFTATLIDALQTGKHDDEAARSGSSRCGEAVSAAYVMAPRPDHAPAATQQPATAPASQQPHAALPVVPAVVSMLQAGGSHELQPLVGVTLAPVAACGDRLVQLGLHVRPTAGVPNRNTDRLTVVLQAADFPEPHIRLQLAVQGDAAPVSTVRQQLATGSGPVGASVIGGAQSDAQPAQDTATDAGAEAELSAGPSLITMPQSPTAPTALPKPSTLLLSVRLLPLSLTLVDDKPPGVTTPVRAVGSSTNTSVTLGFAAVTADVSLAGPDVEVSGAIEQLVVQTGFTTCRQAQDTSEYRPSVLQPWLQIAKQVTASHVSATFSKARHRARSPASGRDTGDDWSVHVQLSSFVVQSYPDQPGSFVLPASGKAGDPRSGVSVAYSHHHQLLGDSTLGIVNRLQIGAHHLTVGVGLAGAVQAALARKQHAPQQPAAQQPTPPAPRAAAPVSTQQAPTNEQTALKSEFHMSVDAECLSVLATADTADMARGATTHCHALLALQQLHLNFPIHSWVTDTTAPVSLQHLLLCVADSPSSNRMLPVLHIPSAVLSQTSPGHTAATDSPAAHSSAAGSTDAIKTAFLSVPSIQATLLQSQAEVIDAVLKQAMGHSLTQRKPSHYQRSRSAVQSTCTQAGTAREAQAASAADGTAATGVSQRTASIGAPASQQVPAWVQQPMQLTAQLGEVCCWWEACPSTAPNQVGQLLLQQVQLSSHTSHQGVPVQAFGHGLHTHTSAHTAHLSAHQHQQHTSGSGQDSGTPHPSEQLTTFASSAAHLQASLQWQEISLQLVSVQRQAEVLSCLPSCHSLLRTHSSIGAGDRTPALATALPSIDASQLPVLRALAAGQRRQRGIIGTSSRLFPLPAALDGGAGAGGLPLTEATLTAGGFGAAGAVVGDDSEEGVTMSRFFSAAGTLPSQSLRYSSINMSHTARLETQGAGDSSTPSAAQGHSTSRLWAAGAGVGGRGASAGASPENASVTSHTTPLPQLARLSRGDTLYCSFRAASAGGPLAGMQDIARLPNKDAGLASATAGGADADDLDFYSLSDGSGQLDDIEGLDTAVDGNSGGGWGVQQPWLNLDNDAHGGMFGLAQGAAHAVWEVHEDTGSPDKTMHGTERSDLATWCLTDVASMGQHVQQGVDRVRMSPSVLLGFLGHFLDDHVHAGGPSRHSGGLSGVQGVSTSHSAAPAMHVPGQGLWSIPEPHESDQDPGISHDNTHLCSACQQVATQTAPGHCQVMLLACWPGQQPIPFAAASTAPVLSVAVATLPVLASASYWDGALWGLLGFISQLTALRKPPQPDLALSQNPVSVGQQAGRANTGKPASSAVKLPFSHVHVTAPDVSLHAYVAPVNLTSTPHAARATQQHQAAAQQQQQYTASAGLDLDTDLSEDESGSEELLFEQDAAHGEVHQQHRWCSSPCATVRVGLNCQLDASRGLLESSSVYVPAVTVAVGQLALQHGAVAYPGLGSTESGVHAPVGISCGMQDACTVSSWAAAAQVEPLLHLGGLHLASHMSTQHQQLHLGDVSVYAAMRPLAATVALVAAVDGAVVAMRARSARRTMHMAQREGQRVPGASPGGPDMHSPFSHSMQQQQPVYLNKASGLSVLGVSPPAHEGRLARQSLRGGSDDGSMSLLHAWQAHKGVGAGSVATKAVDALMDSPAQPQGPGNPFHKLPTGVYSVQADQVAVLLSTEAHHSFVPLFEVVASQATLQLQCNPAAPDAAASRATAQLAAEPEGGAAATSRVAVAVHVGMSVQVDVFNVEKMGWEPLLDPWNANVAYELWQPLPSRQPGGIAASSRVSHHVVATAHKVLQLTAGPAALAALGKAEHMLKQLQAHHTLQRAAFAPPKDPQGVGFTPALDWLGAGPMHAATLHAPGLAAGNSQGQPPAALSVQPMSTVLHATDIDTHPHSPRRAGAAGDSEASVLGAVHTHRWSTLLAGTPSDPDLPIASFWLRNVLGMPIEFCISDRPPAPSPLHMPAAWDADPEPFQSAPSGSMVPLALLDTGRVALQGRFTVSSSELHLRHLDLSAGSCADSLRCSMTDLHATHPWASDTHHAHHASVAAAGHGFWARGPATQWLPGHLGAIADSSDRLPPVLPLLTSQRPSLARDPRLQHQAISKTAAAAAQAATAAARQLSSTLSRRQSMNGISPARVNTGVPPSSHPKALYFRLHQHPSYGVWGPVDLTASSLQAFAMQPSFVGANPGLTSWAPGSLGHFLPTIPGHMQPATGYLNALMGAAPISTLPQLPVGGSAAASSSLFRVLCDVSAPQHAGRCVSVHTNVKLINTLSVEVAIGDAGDTVGLAGRLPTVRSGSLDPYSALNSAASTPGATSDSGYIQQPFSSPAGTTAATPEGSGNQPPATLLQRLAPGQSMWLPAPLLLRRGAPNVISLQALPGPHRAPSALAWSDPVDLRALVTELSERLASSMGQSDSGLDDEDSASYCCTSRVVRCRMWSAGGHHHGRDHATGSPQVVHMLLVATRSEDGKAWELTLQPALMLCNQLPVPLQAALQPVRGMARELRQPVQPQQRAAVLLHDPGNLQCVLVRPRGFTWSGTMDVQDPLRTVGGPVGTRGVPLDLSGDTDDEDDNVDQGPDTVRTASWRRWSTARSLKLADYRFLVSAPGPGAATVALRLKVLRHASGQVLIHVSSLLWLYNCTGLPIALRVCPTALTAAAGAGGTRARVPTRPVTTAYGTSPVVAAATGSLDGQPQGVSVKAAQQDSNPATCSELWATPCVGPDGELLAVAAPRASHNAAVQAMHTALQEAWAASSATQLSKADSVSVPGAPPPVNAPPPSTQYPPRTTVSGFHAPAAPRSEAGTTRDGLARSVHGADSNVSSRGLGLVPLAAGTNAVAGDVQLLPGSKGLGVLAKDIPAPASVGSTSRIPTQRSPVHTPVSVSGFTTTGTSHSAGTPVGRTASSETGDKGACTGLRMKVGGESLTSKSSVRSLASASSYSATEANNPFWQPAMQPTICGELDPLRMPFQLRVMPQASSAAGTHSKGAGKGAAATSGVQQSWSRALRLSHAGCMDVVALPCPVPKEDAAVSGVKNTQAGAFFVSVRLVRIPGARRCWALHVLPRFVLYNALNVPLQLQQPGAGRVRTLLGVEDKWAPLGPGQRRPVHWPDANAALRLSLKVSEPGWSWSGSVDVGGAQPGDLFVKVRHRNLQETLLVRVDLRNDASGVLLVSMSHHPSAFSPYRVDNFTSQSLHVQQSGCTSDDIIRPYSCLPYAWDEPSLPHKLAVSLPGGLSLGTFSLDTVGLSSLITLKAGQGSKESRRFMASVVASGPTRVLKVTDLAVHDLGLERQPGSQAATELQLPSWILLTQQLTQQLAQQVGIHWSHTSGHGPGRGVTFWKQPSLQHDPAPPLLEPLHHPEPGSTAHLEDLLHGHHGTWGLGPGHAHSTTAEASTLPPPQRSSTSQKVRTAVSSFWEHMHTAPLSLLSSSAEAVNERYLKPAMQKVGPHLTRVLSVVSPVHPATPARDAATGSGDAWSSAPQLPDSLPASARLTLTATAVQRVGRDTDTWPAAAESSGPSMQLTVAAGGGGLSDGARWSRRDMVGPGKAPLLLSVTVAAAGLGLSCVSDIEEIAYLHLGGMQVGLTVSNVQAALHVTLGQLRIDNCLLDAAHPTAICSPVTYSLFGPPQPILPSSDNWSSHTTSSTTRSNGLGNSAVGKERTPPAAGHAPGRQLANKKQITTALAQSSAPGADMDSAWLAAMAGDGSRATAAKAPSGALTVNTCIWLNKPGGVLCVQHASVQLAPIALNVEEAHVRLLVSYVAGMTQLRAAALQDGRGAALGGAGIAEAAGPLWQPGARLPPPSSPRESMPTRLSAPAVDLPTVPALAADSLAWPPRRSLLTRPSAGTHRIAVASGGGTTARDVSLQSEPSVVVAQALDVGHSRHHPAPSSRRSFSAHMPWEPQTRMLADPNLLSVLQRPKLYIDSLAVSRLRVALSFLPAPWRSQVAAADASYLHSHLLSSSRSGGATGLHGAHVSGAGALSGRRSVGGFAGGMQ